VFPHKFPDATRLDTDPIPPKLPFERQIHRFRPVGGVLRMADETKLHRCNDARNHQHWPGHRSAIGLAGLVNVSEKISGSRQPHAIITSIRRERDNTILNQDQQPEADMVSGSDQISKPRTFRAPASRSGPSGANAIMGQRYFDLGAALSSILPPLATHLLK